MHDPGPIRTEQLEREPGDARLGRLVLSAALDRDLETISRWGIRSDLETVLTYARAADTVARYELELPRSLEGAVDGGDGPNMDRLATFVARGVYADSRLLLRLLAVAQASRAIDRSN